MPTKKKRRKNQEEEKNHAKFEPREISRNFFFVNLHEHACFITCFTWYQAYVQHFIWFYSDKLAHWRRKKKNTAACSKWHIFFINFLAVMPMYSAMITHIAITTITTTTLKCVQTFIGIQAHNFTMLQRIQIAMSLILYAILWDIRKHASHNASFAQLSGLRRKYRNEYWTKINYLSNDCYALHIDICCCRC